MTSARDYPSRLMTAHCEALPRSNQPGVVRVEEPAAAFPRSGYCKDATYYAVNGCEDNLVNVRPDIAALTHAIACMRCLQELLQPDC
jgi:hypothetical protein